MGNIERRRMKKHYGFKGSGSGIYKRIMNSEIIKVLNTTQNLCLFISQIVFYIARHLHD